MSLSKNVRKGKKRIETGSTNAAMDKDTEDDQHLLAIFPEEIWGLVFGYVKAFPTYQKITSASNLFQKIFKPHRVYLLLSDVITLVIRGGFGLERSDLLSLRSACHSWKSVMDTKILNRTDILGNHLEIFDQYDFPFEEDDNENFQIFRANNVFQKFETHFDTTHLSSGSNPFLVREIVVKMSDECQRLYFNAFMGMLRKYGHHVLKCTLEFAGDIFYPEGAYEELGDVLNLMPNLTFFKIASHESCLENKVQMKVIKRAYQTLVLPSARKLQNLCLKFVPGCVIKKLLQSNTQIETITVLGTSGKDYLQSSFESLSNLKEIWIEITNVEDLSCLRNCVFSCHPTKLQLNMSDRKISKEGIFRTVEDKFGETLTELHLLLVKCKDLQYTRGLKLSKLEKFTLEMDYPASIDFILPLRNSLQQLRIEIIEEEMSTDENFHDAKKRESKSEDVIKIYKYWSTLHKSNLWENFPKLKIVETKCEEYDFDETYACTRAKWIRKARKTRSSSYSESDSSDYDCPSYLDCD